MQLIKVITKKITTILQAVDHCNKYNTNLHILGLLSDGGVHGDTEHIIATLDTISRQNFEKNVYLHLFTDGRDSSPTCAKGHFQRIEKAIKDNGAGIIGTVCGRNWAMDRSEHWDRTEKAYNLLTKNIGTKFNSYEELLEKSYAKGITDEFIEPSVITEGSNIRDRDAVLYLNFRPDRTIQLSQAITEDNFKAFPREKLQQVFFASMVEYRKNYPEHVIIQKQYVNLSLGRVLSTVGLRQLRIAEDEKFPHVTYFFNGGISVRFSGEDRIQVPSPIVPYI